MEQFHTVIRRIVADFEAEHGYLPGSNEVVVADGDHELDILKQQLAGRVPERIDLFFTAITEVSLEDLWNGYFIGPPSWSAGIHQSGEPPLHPHRRHHSRGADHRL